ncbi:carbohydrate-binding family 9-like protein [Bacteroidales bacterium]|nr:carbohydrate-binding family 9-like protein [Bacteroidales bacterium]
MKKIIAIVFVLGVSFFSVFSNGKEKQINVPKASSNITVDGKLDEKCWQKSPVHTFNHFYNVDKPTDKQTATFRMLWDDVNLYLFYQCNDQYITAREKVWDGAPYLDDCAEIFILPTTDKINMHFGYELNLYKVANDFVFLNDFYKNERIAVKAYNPDYEVAVTIDGTLNDNSDKDKGWTMEMAIPIKAFYTAGQLTPFSEGAVWRFIAVRQDRNDAEGERRSTSTNFPIHPKKVDVHDPKYFGLMKFVTE